MADQQLQQQSVLSVLVSGNKIDAEQAKVLEEQAEKSDVPLDQYLESEGVVSSEEIAEAKAQMYGLPYANLAGMDVPKDVLNIIPSRIAKTYKFAAFEHEGNKIKLGVLEPVDLKAEEALQLIANRNGLEFVFYIMSRAGFEHLYNQYSNIETEVEEALKGTETDEQLTADQERREMANEEIEEQVRNAPISKVVATILKNAVRKNASDIHVEPRGKEIQIRFRVDGTLERVLTLPIRVLPSVVSRVKVLSSLKIDESRLPQDGRFSTTIDKKQIDFRVSIIPVTNSEVRYAEKVVMRVLDKSKSKFDLETLGLWGKRQDDVMWALKQPFGMFLMTGPTGSGKTTTLYGALEIIAQDAVNVSTLEDPVEYYIDGVNQSQINPDIGFTFAKGLRSLLRQDPDGIMVGEIRDQETAEMAIHSALTGHIVLSTLHTNTAAGAIPRFIDMGVEPFLIASSTNMVAAQRLVRTLCENCKKEVELTGETAEMVHEQLAQISEQELKKLKIDKNKMKMYQSDSCGECKTGYKGRMAIFETITLSDEIKDMIPSKPSSQDIEKVAREQGSISIFQDGLTKVLTGHTSLEEVLRITRQKTKLNINT